MTDGITLTLTPAERGAVAHELRRYGNYRRGIGDDLWDSAITPEAGEPDPPDITPKVEQMVDIHLGFAERCESLAAAFESDEPMVSLDRSAIDVIGMDVEEGFIDEFPPEIARTAMLCRLVSRRESNASEQSMGTTGEVMIVPAEPQTPRKREVCGCACTTHGRGQCRSQRPRLRSVQRCWVGSTAIGDR